MTTQEKKTEVLAAVNRLFADRKADLLEQVQALEEIENHCREMIDCLEDQLRNETSV